MSDEENNRIPHWLVVLLTWVFAIAILVGAAFTIYALLGKLDSM